MAQCIDYLKKTEEKKGKIKDSNESGLKLIKNDWSRSKYSDEEIKSLRTWMCDNMYTRDSPLKNDTKWKKDHNGMF